MNINESISDKRKLVEKLPIHLLLTIVNSKLGTKLKLRLFVLTKLIKYTNYLILQFMNITVEIRNKLWVYYKISPSPAANYLILQDLVAIKS